MGMGPVWQTPARQDQLAQEQYQQQFDQSAYAPIPGVNAPYGPVGTIPGAAPQPLPGGPPPPMQLPPPMGGGFGNFQSTGRFGQQAMLMAGLLGNNVPSPQQPMMGYQGLLGKRPYPMPGRGK